MSSKSGRNKKKTLMGILRSQVSLGSIVDLMTYQIPLPYRQQTVDRVRDVVAGETASAEEVEALIADLQQQGEVIHSLLLEKGLVSEEDLEKAKNEQEKTGLPFFQSLVNLKIIPPDEVSQMARMLQHELEERVSGKRLEDHLLSRELVSTEDLDKAKTLAGQERIGLEEVLLRIEAAGFDDLAKVLDEEFDVRRVALEKESVSRALVNLLPDSMMREYRLIPFQRKGDEVQVAMANPRDQGALDKVKLITGLTPIPRFADPEEVKAAHKKYLIQVESKAGRVTSVSAESLEMMADSESTVKMVSSIIEGAVHARATDIHVEPQEENLRVRYRIDGMLYDIMRIPQDLVAPAVSRLKVMARMNITERRRPQDGHIGVEVDGRLVNLRAATLPSNFGEKIVLRVIDESAVMRGLAQLGFYPDELDRIKRLISRPYGVVLATGPMGSGKTTTLYAALSEVNAPTRNIVTIEDPIEYQLPGITQVRVDPKVDLTFASGLRAILRQDVNILMVGEIRDSETASVAARAATTGHLIFSTLHTNSAVGAVSTLRNLGVPSFMIANTLVGVISQRLVRKVCPECAEEYVPPVAARALLGLGEKSKKTVRRAVGCDKCYHTGYTGRTAVYEILENTETVSNLISQESSEREITKAAEAEGHRDLEKCTAAKVLDGTTTIEELYRTIVI